MSLAVQPAGALGCAEEELLSSEVSVVTLTVQVSIAVRHTGPSCPPYGVAGFLAERLAQVAPGGEQSIDVAQTGKEGRI